MRREASSTDQWNRLNEPPFCILGVESRPNSTRHHSLKTLHTRQTLFYFSHHHHHDSHGPTTKHQHEIRVFQRWNSDQPRRKYVSYLLGVSRSFEDTSSKIHAMLQGDPRQVLSYQIWNYNDTRTVHFLNRAFTSDHPRSVGRSTHPRYDPDQTWWRSLFQLEIQWRHHHDRSTHKEVFHQPQRWTSAESVWCDSVISADNVPLLFNVGRCKTVL